MTSIALDQTYAHAPPRYPAHLVASRRLPDGTELVVRPIHPDDYAMERAFIRSLSRDAGYNRLLSSRKLTSEEIRRLTRIDYDREMAFVALLGVGAQARLLGVARYVKDTDSGGAEFAVVVADAWQRKGVGTVLLGRLLRHAQTAGIRRLHGITLATNQAMQNLARRLGLVQENDPQDATVRLLAKVLNVDPVSAPFSERAGKADSAAANDAAIAHGDTVSG